jgi:hypothetical protein
MVRGLDGFSFDTQWRCAVLKGLREGDGLARFRWSWRGGNTSSHSEQSS